MASNAVRPPSAVLWQHPFVDVFKTFAVDTFATFRGDVTEELDREINKRVFRIRGSVSANNYLQLPQTSAVKSQGLGLTGEYLYLQLKPMGMKHFLVHLDIHITMANALRITLSNMFSEVKLSYRTLQCPCNLADKWTVVCLHVPSVLTMFAKSTTRAYVLKSVQVCATVSVRNLYTSDIQYTPGSMPRDMMLDQNDQFDWITIPDGGAVASSPAAGQLRDSTNTMRHRYSASPKPTARLEDLPPAVADLLTSSIGVDPLVASMDGAAGLSVTPSQVIAPEPMLRVTRLVGVTKKTRRLCGTDRHIPRRTSAFVRCDESEPKMSSGHGSTQNTTAKNLNALVVASSMALILVEGAQAPIEQRRQRCFFGHSRPIELLEASDDGRFVVSVQGAGDGSSPLLRFWRLGGVEGLKYVALLS